MIVTVPIPVDPERGIQVQRPKYEGVPMSLEDFLNWNPEESEGFKYEWNNGVLEADASMKLPETRLYKNINRKFVKTHSYAAGAELIAEVECHLAKINQVRRPDICVLRKEQIENPDRAESAVPDFVIEIISPSNSSNEVESKMHDYFRAGVKTVWHIYPNLKEVRVYYSPKQIKVRADDDECDTGQAFPDFTIRASEIFG